MDNTVAPALTQAFGNRVRVRVCGIALQEDRVLLACHKGMGVPELWLPPGGGLDFQEPVYEALMREFQEETGLKVAVARFMFLYEVMRPPFHAIELFFELSVEAGEAILGSDPEIAEADQSLHSVTWLSWEEINALPKEAKHNLFNHCHSSASLRQMAGFYTLDKRS